MALWNYCAICGKRIEVGEPCLGIEKKNAEIADDSICFDCVKIENINGLDKTVSITDLLARAEAEEKIVDEYAESARAIALWLSAFCDKSLSCPSMISNAARKVSLAYADMEVRAEKAERERDAAVSDMEALMWHSGDGCNICANAIEVHRKPYVRLDCALKGQECNPKWRGQKEE